MLKFQRRLERSPQQVVRYSWGGEPLWMAPPPQEVLSGAWPPVCSLCGAPRTFEVQVLPTLHAGLLTAGGKHVISPEATWGTACVFTCSQDCMPEGHCDEFVVAQPAI